MNTHIPKIILVSCHEEDNGLAIDPEYIWLKEQFPDQPDKKHVSIAEISDILHNGNLQFNDHHFRFFIELINDRELSDITHVALDKSWMKDLKDEKFINYYRIHIETKKDMVSVIKSAAFRAKGDASQMELMQFGKVIISNMLTTVNIPMKNWLDNCDIQETYPYIVTSFPFRKIGKSSILSMMKASEKAYNRADQEFIKLLHKPLSKIKIRNSSTYGKYGRLGGAFKLLALSGMGALFPSTKKPNPVRRPENRSGHYGTRR